MIRSVLAILAGIAVLAAASSAIEAAVDLLLLRAHHASPFQWVITAVLSIPAALLGGILFERRQTDEGLEKAPASA
jgi:hypothetical protein